VCCWTIVVGSKGMHRRKQIEAGQCTEPSFTQQGAGDVLIVATDRPGRARAGKGGELPGR
jgi:hypothetical protein